MRQFTYLINPVAGGRRSGADCAIRRRIAELDSQAEVVLTRRPGHAEQLARERSMNKDQVVVAVGGDGTVHEVARGLVGARAVMAVLPLGSGNDFARMLHSPRDPEQAIAWFALAEARACDVGQVRVERDSGEVIEAHFINSLGIGFEAVVAASAARARVFKGFSRYLVAALTHLWTYRAPEMLLRYADREINARQFLVALGNGRSAGGGFQLTPEAELDDGLLDLCRADDLSLPSLIRILPSALRGTHARFAGVHTDRIDRISIDCPSGCGLHADGEVLADDAVRIEVSVYRGGLRILG